MTGATTMLALASVEGTFREIAAAFYDIRLVGHRELGSAVDDGLAGRLGVW